MPQIDVGDVPDCPLVLGVVAVGVGGGIGLLAVAALLERSERSLLPTRPNATDHDRSSRLPPVESMTEMFTRTFE